MEQHPDPASAVPVNQAEEALNPSLTTEALAAVREWLVKLWEVSGENWRISEQKIALESATQELKSENKQPKFRFRGNKEQFKFNSKGLELVEQGLKLINSGSSATPILEKAKEELSEKNKFIAKSKSKP